MLLLTLLIYNDISDELHPKSQNHLQNVCKIRIFLICQVFESQTVSVFWVQVKATSAFVFSQQDKI